MEGELQKLKIVAYSDPEYNNKVDDGEFTTLVNPENYTFKYSVDLEEDQAPGSSSAALKFNKISPQELEFDFIFDSTGAIPNSSENVVEDIEKLKSVALNYQGDQHKPNYVRLSWGTLIFKGCLNELSVTFKLFKSDGTPIRATAKGKFKGFVEDSLRVAQENAQSPDLTHIRIVKDGETLPYLSYQVYGDSKYYLEVARANNLSNFRNLKAGQKIVFPPIDKSAS